VIIPTFNSSGTIGKTLESVANQTWKEIEIIVVDNYSTDDTLAIASRFVGVKAFLYGPERSGQVNFGVKRSKGDYVYRIDSDFVLDPRVGVCQKGADAVLVHNTSDPSISFWAKVRKTERDSLVDDWEHVAARFVRKDVFEALGGFDVRFYAEEDRDFHERLVAAGYKVGRTKAAELHIGEPRTLAEVVRKHVYYGPSIRRYVQLKGAKAGLRLGPFRRALLRHWRDVASDPIVLIGFFVYQYVRYLSSVFGLLVSQPGATRRLEQSLEHRNLNGGDVSVVVVTRNRAEDLEKCLASLERAEGRVREVLVIDDASTVPINIQKSKMKTMVLRNETRSFLSRSRNRGAMDSSGDYVMFIDDDNIVDAQSISRLSAVLDKEPLAMVASPVICYTVRPKRVWFAGGWLAPISGIFVAAYRGADADSLPTTPFHTELFHDAFMVRRDAFRQVGYFDETNFPMYLSEADLAARLKRRGFRAIVVPRARVWHNIPPLDGTASLLRGVHITEPVRAYFVGRNRLLYMRRYSNRFAFLIHVIVFEPVIILIHLYAMLSGHARIPWTRLFGPYLRGVFDGLSGRIRLGRRLLQSSLAGDDV
jgi:GT2 family glycosyltransferase